MLLYWCDAETSGLVTRGPHRLLELGLYQATLEDPYTITNTYLYVFSVRREELSMMDPFILKMHSANGLLEECLSSILTVEAAEAELLNRVPLMERTDDQPRLAGFSVSFDHEMLKTWMPRLAARFAHNYYCVSSKKIFCRKLGMPQLPQGRVHRVHGDILESMEHDKLCDAWLEEYYYETRRKKLEAAR